MTVGTIAGAFVGLSLGWTSLDFITTSMHATIGALVGVGTTYAIIRLTKTNAFEFLARRFKIIKEDSQAPQEA